MLFLENNLIKIEFPDPNDPNDKHLFTRYNHLGYIVQITDKRLGMPLLSEPAGEFHPFSGEGFPDEFERPVGYDEAEIGDNFIKIGVGLEEKLADTVYTNHDMHPVTVKFPVTVEQSGDEISFSQKGCLNSQLAFSYSKKVSLHIDGSFSIAHSLKNDGENPWQTLWYSHAFLPLDPRTSEMILRHTAPSSQLFENIGTGYRYSATGDFTCDELQIYSNPRIISPEPKINIRLEPNRQFGWATEYIIQCGR